MTHKGVDVSIALGKPWFDVCDVLIMPSDGTISGKTNASRKYRMAGGP